MSHPIVITTLKRLLKAKKISYKDLADEIGMSESGVKKLLTAKDISLSRLGRIAESLGMSLADLLLLAQEEEIKSVSLSPRQENTLFENNSLFRVFWLLAVEEKTLDEIRKIEKISQDQLQRYLLRLENLDLIKINRKGSAAALHKGLYRWIGDGKLLRKLNHEWSEITLKKVLQDKQGCSMHRLSYLQLSQSSRQDFYRRLTELADEYARRSQREKLELPKNELESLSLLFALSPTGFLI